MFNISFSELLIILLVAFLVVGPKDLAKVARSLGRAVKKGRNFIYDIKSYVNSDGDNHPIRDVKDAVSDVKEEINKANPLAEVKEDLEKEMEPLKSIEKEMEPLKTLKKGKTMLKK